MFKDKQKDIYFFSVCLLVLLLLTLGDILSTYLALSVGAQEGNPIIAKYFDDYGLELGLIPMFFLQVKTHLIVLILPHLINLLYVYLRRSHLEYHDRKWIHICQIVIVLLGIYTFVPTIINNFRIFFSYL